MPISVCPLRKIRLLPLQSPSTCLWVCSLTATGLTLATAFCSQSTIWIRFGAFTNDFKPVSQVMSTEICTGDLDNDVQPVWSECLGEWPNLQGLTFLTTSPIFLSLFWCCEMLWDCHADTYKSPLNVHLYVDLFYSIPLSSLLRELSPNSVLETA